MALHSLDISSKMLRRCCHIDMTAKGGRVSRTKGSGCEGETGIYVAKKFGVWVTSQF
jgi:hypothetical protein